MGNTTKLQLATRTARLLATITVLIAGAAHADDLNTRIYVGAKVLHVNSINADVLAARLAERGHNVTIQQHDDDAPAGALSVGFMFEDDGFEAGVELGYQYIDDLDTRLSTTSTNAAQLGQDLSDLKPRAGHSMYAAVAWMIPLTERLQARVKTGYLHHFSSDLRMRVNNNVVDIKSADESGHIFGAGLRVKLTPLWYMAAEWNHQKMGDLRRNDVYTLGVERILHK